MRDVISQFSAIVLDADFKELILPDQYVMRASIQLRDTSQLMAKEYLFHDTGRTKYSYHWMTKNKQLLIRWDDSHEYAHVPTSPHHQHLGTEENVQPSEPMTLQKVLTFIAAQLTVS